MRVEIKCNIPQGSSSGYQQYHHNLSWLNITEANWRSEQNYVVYSLVDGAYLYQFIRHSDHLLLGRSSVTNISTTDAATEFWDGSHFQHVVKEAVPILERRAEQVTVYWNRFLQRYIMLAAGDPIVLFAAENLWGTWSRPVDVYKVPKAERQEGNVTNIRLHPELWREDGKIIVFSYCIAGAGDGLPYFVEVSFERNPLFIPVA
jgi:hypothetical protein